MTVGILAAAKLDSRMAGTGTFLDDDRGGQGGFLGAFVDCLDGVRRYEADAFLDDVPGVLNTLCDMCFSVVLDVWAAELVSCLMVSGCCVVGYKWFLLIEPEFSSTAEAVIKAGVFLNFSIAEFGYSCKAWILNLTAPFNAPVSSTRSLKHLATGLLLPLRIPPSVRVTLGASIGES